LIDRLRITDMIVIAKFSVNTGYNISSHEQNGRKKGQKSKLCWII